MIEIENGFFRIDFFVVVAICWFIDHLSLNELSVIPLQSIN